MVRAQYELNQSYVSGTTLAEGLVADISVRGVYESQVEASIDIRVTDTDAESYKLKSVLQVLKSQETEKKRRYKKACEERRWCFTPFVCSVDGALDARKHLGSFKIKLTS